MLQCQKRSLLSLETSYILSQILDLETPQHESAPNPNYNLFQKTSADT